MYTLFIIQLHGALHGSARRNDRSFHCSVCSVYIYITYLTFYCRNIVGHIALDD